MYRSLAWKQSWGFFSALFLLGWSCARHAWAFVFWLFFSPVWHDSGKMVVAFDSFLQSRAKKVWLVTLHVGLFWLHAMSLCNPHVFLGLVSWLCLRWHHWWLPFLLLSFLFRNWRREICPLSRFFSWFWSCWRDGCSPDHFSACWALRILS